MKLNAGIMILDAVHFKHVQFDVKHVPGTIKLFACLHFANCASPEVDRKTEVVTRLLRWKIALQLRVLPRYRSLWGVGHRGKTSNSSRPAEFRRATKLPHQQRYFQTVLSGITCYIITFLSLVMGCGCCCWSCIKCAVSWSSIRYKIKCFFCKNV